MAVDDKRPRLLDLLIDHRRPNDLKNCYEGQMFSMRLPIRICAR
ncbi:hypothetical protein U2261_01485 [Achromobacter xylosoxidans]|jgi:hypothetical protein|nr:hypothetical protein [Achromobacter xylosoxidans]CCH07029.1 hypothetical protein NH44784_030691 [Achromobacter xylosoxidans NH44784-1996]MDH0518810.1 hypothetical protein [Achromobacter xylosoxidans]MDH0543072.1 hypothetical protein [Achromobacter xylosoxidans]MDZ5613256.1 hypothetical protein [Achromobacter xylosoxidans]MDZ5688229.1 hypothetical protein [Achromobacter xylosoxidans]